MRKMQALIAVGFLGAGLALAGCKSVPPLAKDQALALIQAKYDATRAAPFTIAVDDMGMQEGVTAGYWVGTRRYPNGYWGDFKLTPAGKGADTGRWWRSHPVAAGWPQDDHYVFTINTVVSNRMKATDIRDIQDQAGGSKMADYTEDVVLTGIPAPRGALPTTLAMS